MQAPAPFLLPCLHSRAHLLRRLNYLRMTTSWLAPQVKGWNAVRVSFHGRVLGAVPPWQLGGWDSYP